MRRRGGDPDEVALGFGDVNLCGVLGLLLGLVGTDVTSGITRFDFGFPALADGIDFVVVAMGLFGIAEIVNTLGHQERREVSSARVSGLWPTRQDFRMAWKSVLRGTALGSALGILPFAESWQVYGRVGMYFAGNDLDVTVSSGDEGASGEDSDNTQEFYWGVGGGYTAGQWTTRLEYQQYMDVGDDSTTGETDISRITLGAIYRF